MAESTLSIDLPRLQREVGFLLGYPRDPDDFDPAQESIVNDVIDSGLRQFYFPEMLDGQSIAHEWSFFKPVLTLSTYAPYGTGTCTVTNGSAIVTFAGATIPTWVSSAAMFMFDGMPYAIATRDSGTQITLAAAWAGATEAGADYQVLQQDYDLPDNFGGIEGDLTYAAADSGWNSVRVISEEQIRRRRMVNRGASYPEVCAIRPKSGFTGANGQRFEILFDPAPNAAYTFSYRAQVLPGQLSESYPYPLGGMAHGETILESCLSVAEQRLNGEAGLHTVKFTKRLTSSISQDARAMTPATLGYNGDPSTGSQWAVLARGQRLTYNGVQY